MTRRSWILMALLAATWGASYLFIKIALRDLGTGLIVSGRTALAAGVLLLVARHRGRLGELRGHGRALAAVAAAQVVFPFLLITVGERWIPSALAGILVASAPIWIALLALRFDAEERSTGRAGAGILIGMAGVVLLFGVDLSGDANTLLGGGMVLLAGLGYAIGPLVVKRRLSGQDPAATAAVTMAIASVATLPVIAIDPPTGAGAGPLAALVVLGLVGTGLAFLIYYTLMVEVGPARSAVVAYLAPGFAVGYGVAFLDESITAGTIAGLVLILVGSWLGTLRRTNRSGPVPQEAVPPEPAREPAAV